MSLQRFILDCPPASTGKVLFMFVINDLNDFLKHGNVNLFRPLLWQKWHVLDNLTKPFEIVDI